MRNQRSHTAHGAARFSTSRCLRSGLRRALALAVAGGIASGAAASSAHAADLFVIGDSISAGGETNPKTPVPYSDLAKKYLVNGIEAQEVNDGATVADNFAAGKYKGVTKALASGAKTFIVELGTNDASCIHLTKDVNDPLWNGACSWYDPATSPQGPSKLARAVTDMDQLAKALLVSSGSCLIWAPPRAVQEYGTTQSEWEFYNSAVRSLASNPSKYKGKMVAFDFTGFANSAASYGDFTGSDGKPNVHQKLAITSNLLGYQLIQSVIKDCGRAAKPQPK